MFPAVIDTGHSHNFSISEQQLRDWAQVSHKTTRIIRVNGRPVPLARADLQLGGIHLSLPEGIAVFAKDHPSATRLPLIGLRALVRNRLKLKVNGRRLKASISRSWW
jgi:hypothetical protein